MSKNRPIPDKASRNSGPFQPNFMPMGNQTSSINPYGINTTGELNLPQLNTTELREKLKEDTKYHIEMPPDMPFIGVHRHVS
jgi:hypothetical protein